MSVIEDVRKDKHPIYTVHDNFIWTIKNSMDFPGKYLKVFRELGEPLRLVNNMIWMNLISIPIEKAYVKPEDETSLPTQRDTLQKARNGLSPRCMLKTEESI
jgi:hypothetical protein